MGKRGALPKKDSRRSIAKRVTEVHVPADLQVTEVPMPAKRWPVQVRRDWETYWASDVAVMVTDSSIAGLVRLFDLRAERSRLFRAEGDGQTKIRQVDVELRQLEDRFGLSPLARVKLGLHAAAVTEAKKAAADAEQKVAAEKAKPRVVRADPRDVVEL